MGRFLSYGLRRTKGLTLFWSGITVDSTYKSMPRLLSVIFISIHLHSTNKNLLSHPPNLLFAVVYDLRLSPHYPFINNYCSESWYLFKMINSIIHLTLIALSCWRRSIVSEESTMSRSELPPESSIHHNPSYPVATSISPVWRNTLYHPPDMLHRRHQSSSPQS